MSTQIVDSAAQSVFTAAMSGATRGARRAAAATALIASFGGRALTLRIKNGATTIATLVTTAGGYAASGPDLVVNTIASSTVASAGTPPSGAPFWTLEIVDQGTVKLLCDSVGAIGSSAEVQVSPIVMGFGLGIGVGTKLGLKFRLDLGIDPFLPQQLTIKAAGTLQANVPHMIGRVFAKGEIPNWPQVVVNGTPTNKQSHVDNRWEDGSAKMCFFPIVQDVATTDTVISFQDRANPNYTTPTLSSILSTFPDFDVTLTANWGKILNVVVNAGAPANSTINGCSLGAGSTPSPSNLQVLLADSVATWRVDGGGDFIVVPLRTATAGQTSVMKFDTTGGTVTYTYTVSAGDLTVYTKSVRAMMTAGAATVKRAGPDCIVVQVADFIAKAHDIGPSPSQLRVNCWIHFWPGLGLYMVDLKPENCDTEKVGGFAASYKVTKGVSSPAVVANCGALYWAPDSHAGKLTFWSTAPFEPDYDYQLSRLRWTNATLFVQPVTVDATHLSTVLAAWAAALKGPGDAGLWTRAMNAPGGRGDLGPWTQWSADWIQTGKATMRALVTGQANLAGMFGTFPREGSATRRFGNRGVTTGPIAQGYPCGFQVRRSACINNYYAGQNGYSGGQPATRAADKSNVIGPTNMFGWLQDDQHCPDAHYPLYLMTGNMARLEDLQLQYCYQVKTIGASGCDVSGADTDTTLSNSWGRNVNPNYFGMPTDIRASAWVMRQAFYVWFISNDADPLKGDAAEALTDLIVWHEAWNNINATARAGRADFVWRRAMIAAGSDAKSLWHQAANPLNILEYGNYGAGGLAAAQLGLFQHLFFDIVLAMAVRGGFVEGAALRNWRWNFWKTFALAGYTTAWCLAGYTWPTASTAYPNRPIQTVAEMLATLNKPSNFDGPSLWSSVFAWAVEQGYGVMLVNMIDMCSDLPDYDWVEAAFSEAIDQMIIDGSAPAVGITTGTTYAIDGRT